MSNDIRNLKYHGKMAFTDRETFERNFCDNTNKGNGSLTREELLN